MTRVLAAPQVWQRRPGDLGQPENIVQLTVDQEASVRRDLTTVKLQLQATVEIDPQMKLSGFTRRVTRGLARCDDGIALILIAESTKHVIKLAIHLGNPG